jgi:plastocyanin
MKKSLLFVSIFALIVTTASAANVSVSMAPGDVFSPANISINKGDMVTWTNNDAEPHTATSGSCGTPNGVFNSGTVNSGGTFSFTFNTAGSFPYYCVFHCALGMVGNITVTDAGTTSTNAPTVFIPGFKSYPNPCSETATLEFELTQPGKVKVEVFNMMGAKITEIENSFGTGTQNIPVSSKDFQAGMYICKLYFNDSPAGVLQLSKK